MMNSPSIAAQGSYRPLAHALHGEGIPPGGLAAVSANSPARAGPIGVDDGEWSIPWPADDLSPAASSIGAAAGYSVRTHQQQSTGGIDNIARRYMDEVKTSAMGMDESLYQLLALMNLAGGETAAVQGPGRLPPEAFSTPDKLRDWMGMTRSGLAALQSTLDEMSAASMAPAAVGRAAAVGSPRVGLAAQRVATTGPADLCVKALRKHPELATDEYLLSSIKEGLIALKVTLGQIEYRLAWDKGRHDVEARMTTLQYARATKLIGLRREAESVSRAGKDAMVAGSRIVRLGDGDMRAPVLGLAARTRAAFGALFTPIGAALGRVLYAFFWHIADYGGGAARLQEHQDAQRIAPALRPLQSSALDGLMHHECGDEVRALLRDVKAGVVDMKYPELCKQFVMGENLVRTLMTAEIPSFGSMGYYDGGEEKPVMRFVSSTLSTARAIACYLDTLADLDDDLSQQSPGIPEVKRQGNSLVVADPQRRLAGFLLSTPSAYTALMAGRTGAALSSAVTIDDHRCGMPGGMRAMRFETVVDEKSGTVGLRLSFTARSACPVYQPLANEGRVLDRMKAAQHGASAAMPQASQDYSAWSVESLRTHFQALLEKVGREAAAFRADQRLLQDIGARDNPRLVTHFA